MTPRVFLCEPSGLAQAQRLVSDSWHERLFGLGFDVDQLRSHEYQRDPWPQLMGRIGAAHGVLILGFSQLSVHAGTWRRGTEQEVDVVTSLTSPWLHVEAGIALASGLPVLVARESGVAEGVFASETCTGELRGTSVERPDGSILDEWAGAVLRRLASIECAGQHQ